jgi:hypothetical protein
VGNAQIRHDPPFGPAVIRPNRPNTGVREEVTATCHSWAAMFSAHTAWMRKRGPSTASTWPARSSPAPRLPGHFGHLTSVIVSLAWWRSQRLLRFRRLARHRAMEGGGALMNQGIHTVDLLSWFMGRPVEIFAHTGLLAHQRVEVEDTAVATIVFESGALGVLGVLHATTAAYAGLTARLQLMGSEGPLPSRATSCPISMLLSRVKDVGLQGMGGCGN